MSQGERVDPHRVTPRPAHQLAPPSTTPPRRATPRAPARSATRDMAARRASLPGCAQPRGFSGRGRFRAARSRGAASRPSPPPPPVPWCSRAFRCSCHRGPGPCSSVGCLRSDSATGVHTSPASCFRSPVRVYKVRSTPSRACAWAALGSR